MPNTRSRASMTREEFEELVNRRVDEEMEAREAARTLEPLNEDVDKQEGENGGNGGNGNGMGEMEMEMEGMEMELDRNWNGENGGDGNGNRNGNHGTEGVVGLTRWFEKMETNSHKRTIGVDVAYAMKWAGLMKLMTEVYCPRNEILKMETELWNLTVKGNDLTAYTQRFQELILLCTRMVPDEEDIVERFIGGLPDNIQGNVIAANPARLQDAIRIANQLMDKKLQGYAARSAENKIGWKVTQGITMENNHHLRGKMLVGRMWLELTRLGTISAAAVPNTQRAPLGNQQGVICYEYGRPGHVKRECPKLRNQNHRNRVGNKTGNQTGGNEATTRAYTIGRGGTNPDSNVVTGTFLLNNCYASMLFDSGANRSFVSSTFSALLDVAPFTLDTSYVVELATCYV
ncbi:reverse transcriptase domain-containing protein [Tanacetum coccineum]